MGKGAAQPDKEEDQSKSKEQKIGPGHIASAGIFGEDGDIAQEGKKSDEEAQPKRCIAAALLARGGSGGVSGQIFWHRRSSFGLATASLLDGSKG